MPGGVQSPEKGLVSPEGAGTAAPEQVSHTPTVHGCQEEAVSELLAGIKSQPSPTGALSQVAGLRCASESRAKGPRGRQLLLAQV